MFFIVVGPDGSVLGLMTSPVDANALRKPVAGARLFKCQANSTDATEMHEPRIHSLPFGPCHDPPSKSVQHGK